MTPPPLPRPEPVTRAGLIAGTVAGLIITIGGLARALGWLTDDLDVHAVARQTSDLILGAGVLWATVAPFVLALWARSQVTPLADPRDRDGNALAPAGDVLDVFVEEDVEAATVPAGYPPTEHIPIAVPPPHLVDPAATAPFVPLFDTAEIPALTGMEPTPIADAVQAAASADTQPAMAAVRA